ncbi:MAG: heme-binding protein [Planctomycetes bacterium]|nr:heme-binding protein [Planctomycetota bacterium]
MRTLAASLLVISVPALTAGHAHAQDLLAAARADARLATLVRAVEVAGLGDALTKGPVTVLAPTDAAFAALPDGALDGLLADRSALTAVLTDHVAAGRQDATALVVAGEVDTLAGGSWPVTIAGGRVRIGSAAVVDTLEVGGSVVHVLDNVLLRAAAPVAQGEDPMTAVYDLELSRAMRSAAAAAAAALDRGLDGRDVSLPKLRAAIGTALTELAEHPLTAARLRTALARAESGGDAGLLYREIETVVSDLRFRPTIEAELPLGFPDTAPIGEVVLKSYPDYRMARTPMAGSRGTTSSFFALFNHIKKNEIAMTAPVQIDYDGTGGEARNQETMAFLYSHPNQGNAGADGNVEVMNVAPTLAISIGARGWERREDMASLQRALQDWLRAHAADFEQAGPLRTMGYNSPMVPAGRRFYEVEIPIRPVGARAAQGD